MKKNILSLLALLLATACFNSCAKHPINGPLDGQWQLMEMALKEHPSDAEYNRIISKKQEQIYWRFQLHLLLIHTSNQMMNGHTFDSSARFVHENNQLDITKTYIHFHDRDSLLTQPNTTALAPMGITGNKEKFDVACLNSKKMILQNASKKLTFRKF